MMSGFSLLEFLIATSLFMVIVVVGLQALDIEQELSRNVLDRTRMEQESNYRVLVLDKLLRDCFEKINDDTLLGKAPLFFPNLQMGQEARDDAFSVALPAGPSARFIRSGGVLILPPTPSFQKGRTVLMAGATESGGSDWNYAKVTRVVFSGDEQRLTAEFLLEKPELVSGSIVVTELHGFVFREQTLYWISPGGQNSPFFGPLREFRYQWNDRQLSLFWYADFFNLEFTTTL